MLREHALHAGQDMAWTLPAGAEVFCAAGALRLTAMPAMPGGCPWLGPHLLLPGQGWRAEQPVLLRLEALQPSRCRLTLAPDAGRHDQERPGPRKNSLLLWGRRLLAAP